VTLEVEVDNRTSWAIDAAAVERVVADVLGREQVDSGEVGVAFVSSDEMATLNAAHRGKPDPTDVLSFPLDGREPVADGVPRQLGDLVVCPDVAASDGTPLSVLLVHGALHLVGYDHERDHGEMLARQETIVDEVGTVDAQPA
jgi:probable rRNA maturation factor